MLRTLETARPLTHPKGLQMAQSCDNTIVPQATHKIKRVAFLRSFLGGTIMKKNKVETIGPVPAVIYARYSSSSQREESIEGQLRRTMLSENIPPVFRQTFF